MEMRNNESLSRYELVDEGRVVAVADYTLRGEMVIFPHTEVDRAMRGRGLGTALVRAALDDVRHNGRSIVPLCWFVAQFVDDNPEYADLLAA